MDKVIYLDNAATTFPKPESVYTTMDEVNRNYAVNSGRGSYKLAKIATKIIDDTKKSILKLANAKDTAKIIFSPSITISFNQILNGLNIPANSTIYVSPYEHNAVARTVNYLSKKNKHTVKELPINEQTLEIDVDKMKYMFSKEPPTCVCATYVSNVTGYILPVSEIFRESKKYNAITVLDAAQALGLIKTNLKELDADFVAFAGHKTLYGPFGIAGFIDNSNIELSEFIVGGTGSDSLNLDMPQISPYKYESASPNIVAIAGLKAALEFIDVEKIYNHEKMLTNYLINELSKIEGVIVYLPQSLDNHVSIVSINIEGYKSEDVGMILDEDYNISIRTGYHCAPLIHKYLNDRKFNGTIRLSIGFFNTNSDIEKLVCSLKDITTEY